MKIKYCKKYEKYVSQQHCEFFNDGVKCEFYSPAVWNSIKELTQDIDRPKWEINTVIKPFKCDLLDREYLNERGRKNKARKLAAAGRA